MTQNKEIPSKRIPRPKGLTYLLKTKREETNYINKKVIRRELIKEYALNGFQFMGRVVDIKTFSLIIGATEVEVMDGLNRGFDDFMTSEMLRKSSALMASNTIFQAYRGTQLAHDQATLLLKAQGGKYKPFISSAVNDAIRGQLQATKVQMDMVKLLNDMSLLQTYIPDKAVQFIGTDEALRLIRQEVQVPLLSNPEALMALKNQYQIGTGPNIIANTQDGTEIIDFEPLEEGTEQAHKTPGLGTPEPNGLGTIDTNGSGTKKVTNRDLRHARRMAELQLTDEADLADDII